MPLQNVLSTFPGNHQEWNNKTFEQALQAFVLNYCSSTAMKEQKGFTKRHLGLPSGQMTATILITIQQFHWYVTYLQGTGNKVHADDIQEMLYDALPNYCNI
jgi:hypothetical protein